MSWDNYNKEKQEFGIKPYILRAYYDWIVDNNEVPIIRVVREFTPKTVWPEGLDPVAVNLDIGTEACKIVRIDNDHALIVTLFGGSSVTLNISVGAIMAIFSQEGTRGTVLPVYVSDGVDLSDTQPDQSPTPPPPRGKPQLRLVK